MAGVKRVTQKALKYSHKIQPYWQIGILFPNGKKIAKPKCSINEIFETYFIGLDKYLDAGFTAEELLDKYKTTFKEKNIKVVIRYRDSWDHLWKGDPAWPKTSEFIDYLNRKLNG